MMLIGSPLLGGADMFESPLCRDANPPYGRFPALDHRGATSDGQARSGRAGRLKARARHGPAAGPQGGGAGAQGSWGIPQPGRLGARICSPPLAVVSQGRRLVTLIAVVATGLIGLVGAPTSPPATKAGRAAKVERTGKP